MGLKYEFTDETRNFNGRILHRIRRLSDGQLGGWIEKEDNLSQEGSCWVDYSAKVYDDAQVSGNAAIGGRAQIYGNAQVEGSYTQVYDDAQVYGNACISWDAQIYGHAKVYEDAKVSSYAKVYDNAQIYGKAKVTVCAEVYGNAQVYGNAELKFAANVYGNMKICSGILDRDNSINAKLATAVHDFIYKIDDSDRLSVKTEYNSIDEYFDSDYQKDVKLDTLIICTADTKIPIIKLKRFKKGKHLIFKFVVDLTTKKEDHFSIKTFITTKEQLSQKLTQIIEALDTYPEFAKYTDTLADCL